MRRVFDDGAGGVTIGSETFVIGGAVTVALPSVAVTEDGVVGVFYYRYNGVVSGFPQFTAWLAISTDQGATFSQQALKTFLSPATDNGDDHQRVFGDYVQMKTVGFCFYGSFTANGAAFGRSTANNDPIFFKACVPESRTNRDFSADSKADILWRNNNGDVALWLMNGASLSSGFSLGSVPNSWKIVGTADFNNDGRADILWRDRSGALAIWFMNGGTVVSATGLGTVPNVWKIVALGDFDGNGAADILWRNTSTGDIAIWFLNAGAVVGSSGLGSVSLDWTAEKAGDFNGDGKADIQWRHNSGAVALWFMNGATVTGGAGLGVVSPTWRIVRLGDLNGDSKMDFIWRHTSGAVAVWLIDGPTVIASAALGVVPTDWRIIGAGDFNTDGKADILWRNIASLPNWDLAMWFMNGTTVSSGASVGTVDASWSTN
jgi:FG-GAP-like repeat